MRFRHLDRSAGNFIHQFPVPYHHRVLPSPLVIQSGTERLSCGEISRVRRHGTQITVQGDISVEVSLVQGRIRHPYMPGPEWRIIGFRSIDPEQDIALYRKPVIAFIIHTGHLEKDSASGESEGRLVYDRGFGPVLYRYGFEISRTLI